MKKVKVNSIYNKVTTRLLILEQRHSKWKEDKRLQTLTGKVMFELIGTFILVFLIITPSTFSFSNSDIYGGFSTIFTIPILSTLWPALSIGLAVAFFYKVSCNLNPAVSLFEWKMGALTTKQLNYYVVAQFIGAISASYVAWAIADVSGVLNIAPLELNGVETEYMQFTLDSLHPEYKVFWPTGSNEIYNVDYYSAKDIGFYGLIMFMEFIGVCGLMWIIVKFSSSPSYTIKIVISTWILIRLMLPFHTFDLNPARAFGPALASFTQGGDPRALWYYWIFLVPQILGALYMGNKYKEEHHSKKWRLRALKNDFKI